MDRGPFPWTSKTLVTKVRVRLWADDEQAITLIENWPDGVNECNGDFSPTTLLRYRQLHGFH